MNFPFFHLVKLIILAIFAKIIDLDQENKLFYKYYIFYLIEIANNMFLGFN